MMGYPRAMRRSMSRYLISKVGTGSISTSPKAVWLQTHFWYQFNKLLELRISFEFSLKVRIFAIHIKYFRTEFKLDRKFG